MEISNNQTWYINPNNRALTSNIKNTEIKDREAFKECMQKPLRPVEDLVSVLKNANQSCRCNICKSSG